MEGSASSATAPIVSEDLDDVVALLALHEDIDRARVRTRVTQLAELADEPAMLAGLALLGPETQRAREAGTAEGPDRAKEASLTGPRQSTEVRATAIT